jgi:hypothetical protein
MQILIMLAFLVAWLIVLWMGSLALEATGLDRPRARFQALSALTGTGFTTSQAELIVEHTKRRRIVTYLIFLGNTAVLGFIVLLVLYIISGIEAPSLAVIALAMAIVIVIALVFWLGLIDKISNGLLKIGRKSGRGLHHVVEDVIQVSQERVIARIKVLGLKEKENVSIAEAGLDIAGFAILLIEHDQKIVHNPDPDYRLDPNDIIIGYGKMVSINAITSK